MGHCGRRAARCYVRGKYRDVILPMTVIRRLDAVLGPTKDAVLRMKAQLDDAGITNQDRALRQASGEAFYNTSPFRLRDLASRGRQQQLRADFEAYLDGFSPNIQEVLDKFKFRNQIPTLVEAAWSASRTKDTCLSAQHRRITPRRGQRRAVVAVAVAHTIIVAIYHMLSNGTRYRDLGGTYFSRRAHHFHLNRAVHQIESLGYRVSL